MPCIEENFSFGNGLKEDCEIIIQIYTKLTTAFAISKNAGIQTRMEGSVKKIEKIKQIPDIRSTILRMSPVVNINKLFNNRSPEQKSIN